MKVAIHQPNFFPWAGFFSKIKNSDIFVLLDDVKCSKNSYFNRNKFSANDKETCWLTIPIPKRSYSLNIKDVNTSTSYINKHIKFLEQRFSKTQEKRLLYDVLGCYDSLRHKDKVNVADFNIMLIQKICDHVGIYTKMIRSSGLDMGGSYKKDRLVIEIVKALNGEIYVSGDGAKEYQDECLFMENNIELLYNTFKNAQATLVGTTYVSALDYILREGKCKFNKMMTLV